MDKLTIILRAPVLAFFPTCPLGYGVSIRRVHLVFFPRVKFHVSLLKLHVYKQLVSNGVGFIVCVSFRSRRWRSSISLHLTFLSRLSHSPPRSASLKWLEKLSQCTYQRSWQVWPNQSCFMSERLEWKKSREKKWFIFTASIYCNKGTVYPTSSN